MCIESPQHFPHLPPQRLERLLARPRVHRVFGEVVEENAVHDDEAYKAPYHDRDLVVPLRTYGLDLEASLELALEAEVLLVRQLAQVGRPLLLCGKAVACEVEGRELGPLAAKEASDESGHLAGRQLFLPIRIRGLWRCYGFAFRTDVQQQLRKAHTYDLAHALA